MSFDAEAKMELPYEERAGARLLNVFASPLNLAVIRTLAERPMRLAELQGEVGSAPQTTLRGNLKSLTELGTIERRRRDGSASAMEYTLTPLGTELLEVGEAVGAWLALGPGGPIALDSEQGKRAVKSLTAGWVSTILRALATGPRTLAELNAAIEDYSYPALERRLSRMRTIGLVETLTSSGTRTIYAVTEWARRSIGPLAIAGRCERRHLPTATAPVTYIEVEAAFLLTLPLIVMPERISGSCALAVDTGPENQQRRVAGIHVEVERGRIVRLSEELDPDPPSWCLGSALAWMTAVIDGGAEGLRIGGANRRLVWALVNGLHLALFPPPEASANPRV